MPAFVRAVEVWVPSASNRELVFSSGSYGHLDEFALLSQRMQFDYGEGLPGRVWAARAPLFLNQLESEPFLRRPAAHDAGLRTALGIPVFSGEYLRGVLVLLCGEDAELSGAVEVWQDDGLEQLQLTEGYYGELKEFARISKRVCFVKGRGLPGICWDTEQPTLIANLAKSNSFLRATDARLAGITTGLAMPCYYGNRVSSIISLLSASKTPLAKRFEVWKPTPHRDQLYLDAALNQDAAQIEPSTPSCKIEKGIGTIGAAWERGIPIVSTNIANDLHPELKSRYDASIKTMLALPIIGEGMLHSVVTLYGI